MKKSIIALALLALSIGAKAQQIALSCYRASVAFDDLKVTDINGNVILSDDFSTKSKLWKADKTWVCENGWLVQKNMKGVDLKAPGGRNLCVFKPDVSGQYDVYVKAKKLGVFYKMYDDLTFEKYTDDGEIIIVFDKSWKRNGRMVSLYGYGTYNISREYWNEKGGKWLYPGKWVGDWEREDISGARGGRIKENQVYDIHLSVRDGGVCCFLDGKPIIGYSNSSKENDCIQSWFKGESENFPLLFLAQFKGKDWARQTMRDTYHYTYSYPDNTIQTMLETAEEGDADSKKKLAMCLWHGISTPQNKKEAVMWLRMIDNPDEEAQDYLIMAKGEGLYDKEIPNTWYEHGHSEALIAAAGEGNQEALRAKNTNSEIRQRQDSAFRGLAQLITAGMKVAAVVGAVTSSSSGGTHSSAGSSSSNSSSSEDNNSYEATYSCKVHLTFSDGDEVYKGTGKAYFKGGLNTANQSYETDKNGYATITWPKSKGSIINCLTLDRNVGFNEAYTKEGLNLEDGGTYTICMDCK